MGHLTKTTAPRRIVTDSSLRRILLRVVHTPDATLLDRDFDLTVHGKSWSFGRGDTVSIADPRLSRTHCRVSCVSGAIRVEDLASTNGCFIQGKRIERDYLLPNQLLRIGDTLLILDEEPGAEQMMPPRTFDAAVPELSGYSFATESVRRWIAAAAPTQEAVLLLGASGTGKEIAARALHRLSGRNGPFVAINCGAIPPNIADAELFGARRGAFTGATEDRPGYFLEAQGGTLFLDELGDLPSALQVKLLRALEERKIRAVGDRGERAIDVRVIAATNSDVTVDSFRQDLRARLSQWVIELKPLRERRADILLIAGSLLRRHDPERPMPRWTTEFAEALLLHDWPLNVRELENLLRRAVSLRTLEADWDLSALPVSLQRPLLQRDAGNPDSDTPARDDLEAALVEAGGNIARVAQKFGRDRTQVYRWLRRHGMDPANYR